jgi:hypothetical protein
MNKKGLSGNYDGHVPCRENRFWIRRQPQTRVPSLIMKANGHEGPAHCVHCLVHNERANADVCAGRYQSLLPFVEQRRVYPLFFAHFGDRFVFQKVQAQDLYFFRATILASFSVAHAAFPEVWKSSLFFNSVSDIPTEPAQYPRTDGSGAGQDPKDGRTIDDAPDADTTAPVWDQNLIETLRETRGYHPQAVKAINTFINQAKVNAGIVVPTGVDQKFSRR